MASRALAPASPVKVFRQTLDTPAFREQLSAALPNHIPLERFQRVATTAVQLNPDLLDAGKVERRSLFGALIRAATDGLLPDGREGVIIPYRGRAVWQPMVAGIMRKVRQSGEIRAWEANAVFERDTFARRLVGDEMQFFHEPFDDGPPGDVRGAYSIVTLRDGFRSKDYLPRWRIDKALAQNPRGADSLMRTHFFDEAAIKTVIRHHAKRLPQSTDIEAIFQRADDAFGATAPAAVNVPLPPPGAESPRRLDAFEASFAPAAEPEPDYPDPANSHGVDADSHYSQVLLDEAFTGIDDAPDADAVNRIVIRVMPLLGEADKPRLTERAMARLAELEPGDMFGGNDDEPF